MRFRVVRDDETKFMLKSCILAYIFRKKWYQIKINTFQLYPSLMQPSNLIGQKMRCIFNLLSISLSIELKSPPTLQSNFVKELSKIKPEKFQKKTWSKFTKLLTYDVFLWLSLIMLIVTLIFCNKYYQNHISFTISRLAQIRAL